MSQTSRPAMRAPPIRQPIAAPTIGPVLELDLGLPLEVIVGETLVAEPVDVEVCWLAEDAGEDVELLPEDVKGGS